MKRVIKPLLLLAAFIGWIAYLLTSYKTPVAPWDKPAKDRIQDERAITPGWK